MTRLFALFLAFSTGCAWAGEVQLGILGRLPGKAVRIALYDNARGFSDARQRLSTPSFEQAAFDLGSDSTITHTLHLQ